MAKAKASRRIYVQVGDGATPTEAFSKPCSFNTNQGISFEATTVDSNVPDCDNPDMVTWIDRIIDTLSSTISGAGTADMNDIKTLWFPWFASGLPRNVRWKTEEMLANGGGHFAGAYVLTSVEIAKEGKALGSFNAEMQSSGPVVFVPATS